MVSDQVLTTRACILSHASQCGICGVQSGIGTDFTDRQLGLPLTVIPPVLHTHLPSGTDRVPRDPLTPLLKVQLYLY